MSKLEHVYNTVSDDMQRWLMCRGVQKREAHDLIQFALLTLSEKLALYGEQHFQKGMEAYAFSVLKYSYFELCKRKSFKEIQLGLDQNMVSSVRPEAEAVSDYNDQITSLRLILERLDEKSYAILKMYYFEKKTLTEIAETLGYKSDKVVKSTKCRLIKRLRRMMTQ